MSAEQKDKPEQVPVEGNKQRAGNSSQGKKQSGYDPFIRETIFPDPVALFSFAPEPLEAVKKQAIVILDANVLLLPYQTGKVALDAIASVYNNLAREQRLLVPEHAAREYAAHRLEKIAKLYTEAHQWRGSLPDIPKHTTPALETLPEHSSYLAARTEALGAIQKCRDAIDAILHRLVEWYHSDPVLAIYRAVFKREVLFGPNKTREELLQDSESRNLHQRPPGSSKEDAGKQDGGIGDKLIWHTILRIAEEKQQHVIFVTQDVTKKDWVHYFAPKQHERVLFPKYELADEFRKVSGGKSFHIVELSVLLKLMEAKKEAIDAIQEAEQQEQAAQGKLPPIPAQSVFEQAKLQLLQQLCGQMPLAEAYEELGRRLRGFTGVDEALQAANHARQVLAEESRRVKML